LPNTHGSVDFPRSPSRDASHVTFSWDSHAPRVAIPPRIRHSPTDPPSRRRPQPARAAAERAASLGRPFNRPALKKSVAPVHIFSISGYRLPESGPPTRGDAEMPAVLFGSIGTVAETSELQRAAFNEAFKEH